MGGQDDLRASLEALVAPRRDQLGGPATPEELLAWRDGTLDPEDRRRVEQKIAVDPDAARALADLAAFPEVAPAPGADELTDEDVDARWQAFRTQLGALSAPPVAHRAHGPSQARTAPSPVLRPGRRQLAAAALLLLGVGAAGGFLAGRGSRGETAGGAGAINVEIVELRPAGEDGVRGVPAVVEVAPDAEGMVLILGTGDHAAFPAYRAEIFDASGALVWQRDGLRATTLGTFQLSFSRGALAPGDYTLRLAGLARGDGEHRTPIATYDLRLRAEAP